jgi:hypothetical protein
VTHPDTPKSQHLYAKIHPLLKQNPHIGNKMQIYLLIACDRLEENQQNKLKTNLPEIQAALQAYVDENEVAKVSLINECESDDCDDWQLGISQTVKKSIQLKFPVNLFNDLAKKYAVDCEVGMIENDNREPVSYFGHEEGRGDSFMIAQYLGV